MAFRGQLLLLPLLYVAPATRILWHVCRRLLQVCTALQCWGSGHCRCVEQQAGCSCYAECTVDSWTQYKASQIGVVAYCVHGVCCVHVSVRSAIVMWVSDNVGGLIATLTRVGCQVATRGCRRASGYTQCFLRALACTAPIFPAKPFLGV